MSRKFNELYNDAQRATTVEELKDVVCRLIDEVSEHHNTLDKLEEEYVVEEDYE